MKARCAAASEDRLRGEFVKNMSLAVKVGILVAVLLATALSITSVSLMQLASLDARFDSMAATTIPKMTLASQVRRELLLAIRAEKNAILVREKTRALEFSDEARTHLKNSNTLRGELTKLIGNNFATPEGKALSEFDRSIEEFEKNQKEVLRLAVIKSIVEGKSILNKELHQRIHDAEDFVTSLNEPGAEGATSASHPASRSEERRVGK